MAGRAAFCPRCGRTWYQVLPHSLAEAADLLQPPVECDVCQTTLSSEAFYCPRCGTEVGRLPDFLPDDLSHPIWAPPQGGEPG